MSGITVTFIGGPLDLQRIQVRDRSGRYYRHVNAAQSGFTDVAPTKPELARMIVYADYEIVPVRFRDRTTHVGILMETPHG